MRGYKVLAAAAVLFGVIFATESFPTVSAKSDLGSLANNSLDRALMDLTGVRLGMNLEEVTSAVDGRCVPLHHVGGRPDGEVTELFCTFHGREGRNLLRIGFSNPEAGQKAWRIYLNEYGPNTRNAPTIREIEKKYGPPKGDKEPLEMWWRENFKTLRVLGESQGLRVELWDRSLGW